MRATRTLLVACAAVLAVVPLAAAQDVRIPATLAFSPRDYTPPVLTTPALTLSEAVRLTIMHSPALSLSLQDVQAAAGRYRETRGMFDASVVVGPTIQYLHTPIDPNFYRLEVAKRDAYKKLADQYIPLAAEFRQMASTLQTHTPACPEVFGSVSTNFMSFSPTKALANAGTGLLDDPDQQKFDDLGTPRNLTDPGLGSLSGLVSLMDLCSLGTGLSEVDEAANWYRALTQVSKIDFSGGYGVGGVLTSVSQLPKETLTTWAQLSDLIGTRAGLAYTRLGVAPTDQLQRQFTLSLRYLRPFRNGADLGANVQLQSTENSYKDKPFDPSFGGLAAPVRFPSKVSFSATVPLGKGRGAVSVTASELSTRWALEARREQVRYATTEEVFRTVLAYVNLAGAQSTVDLLEESAARQANLAKLTEQQVTAGDVPAMELNRVRARAAAVNTSLKNARATLVAARVGLAQSIGAGATVLDAMPRAADRLAVERLPVGAINDLVRIAIVRRNDLRALERVRRATAALDAGAHADLKRLFDVTVSGGLQNTYESPLFYFYPDEEQPIYSDFAPKTTHESPVRFYDARGYARSLTGRWEPFIQAQFKIDLPFGNNAARGRAAQTRADLQSRGIEMVELERSIRENVNTAAGALGITSAAIDRAEETVKYDADVLEGTMRRFEVGELTLFDTLRTEEQVTTDKLELIRLQQTYLGILVRLRFEMGDLVRTVGGTAAATEELVFEPAGIVIK